MTNNCLVCGKEFKVYPSMIKSGRGRYCSKKCVFTIRELPMTNNPTPAQLVWKPHAKQEQALLSRAFETLYGGARGGG